KVRGCVNQTAWAMNYVSEFLIGASVPSPDASKKSTDSTSGTEATDISDATDTTTDTKKSLITSIDHCSTAIFDEVRQRTGIGDAYLQQLSTGLSGGIGLSGGGCAALSAAIMLLGLKFGNEKINFNKGEKRSPLRLAPPKFTKTANKLLKVFKKKFGSLECREITATKFDSIASFNEYRSQGHCIEIKEFVNKFMVKALLPKKKT
ncbi:MAG: C-GCAxxG-C-C family (seleno)protein, partial [Promethearchaeota archaeon]